MTEKQCVDSLSRLLEPYARRCEADIERWLVGPDTPASLAEAMRYCTLGGGKRLRPALVSMVAEALGGDQSDDLTRRAAVAIELVHCYSLVHDDLPAMDDDVLRRGRPTAHVQFGEAMAILIGDALLTRAFAVLCESGDGRSASLAAELARGAGAGGMIAGQVADMGLCRVPAGPEGLRFIQLRKTAAMMRASARMGAICAAADVDMLDAVSEYAESVGLAFQVVDDLLDAAGDVEVIGKTPGKDARSGKRTYVSWLGPEKAGQLCRQLTRRAAEALTALGDEAGKLKRLAELLAGRSR